MAKEKKKKTFSKTLLVQESILIWIVTLAFIFLTFFCVTQQFFGELPWITGIAGFAWTAYGVSQAFYYKKSEKENIEGGITYLNALNEFKEKMMENATSSDDEEILG